MITSSREARELGAATRFKPGQSGNPNGRPKGFRAYIREKTEDGKLLVDQALSVLHDETARAHDKLAACRFLAEYGWGKPRAQQDLDVDLTYWVETLRPYLTDDPAKRDELSRLLAAMENGYN